MITWQSFFDRIVNLSAEFQLAGEAIQGWAHSQEALDHYAKIQLESLRAMFAEAKKDDAWVFSDEERIAKYVNFVKKNAPERIDDVRKRLVQHEYILHVTIFESTLKAIHRAILTTAPKLLRQDRQIPLGRLVSEGSADIVTEEIEREVQALDRKSAKEKYEYFRDRLRINWFDGTIVPLFDSVLHLRNLLLHENPDLDVDRSRLALLSIVSTGIILASIIGGAVLYPGSCALPEGLDQEATKHFVVK